MKHLVYIMLFFTLTPPAMRAQIGMDWKPEENSFPPIYSMKMEDCIFEPHYNLKNQLKEYKIGNLMFKDEEHNTSGQILKRSRNVLNTDKSTWARLDETHFTYNKGRLVYEYTMKWPWSGEWNLVNYAKRQVVPTLYEEKHYTRTSSPDIETVSITEYDENGRPTGNNTIRIKYLNKNAMPDSILTFFVTSDKKELVDRTILKYDKKNRCTFEKRDVKLDLNNPRTIFAFPESLYDEDILKAIEEAHAYTEIRQTQSENEADDSGVRPRDIRNWWKSYETQIKYDKNSITYKLILPGKKNAFTFFVDYDEKGRVISQRASEENQIKLNAFFNYDKQNRTRLTKEIDFGILFNYENSEFIRYSIDYNESGEEVCKYEKKDENGIYKYFMDTKTSFTPSGLIANTELNYKEEKRSDRIECVKVENRYDGNDRLIRKEKYIRIEGEEWKLDEKDFYEYDKNSYLTLYEHYAKGEGDTREVKSYDDKGNVLYQENYIWQDDEWIKNEKSYLQYSPTGKKLLTESYTWQTDKLEWEGLQKDSLIYDNRDSIATKYKFDWDTEIDMWAPLEKYDFAYDSIAYTETCFLWENEKWAPYSLKSVSEKEYEETVCFSDWIEQSESWRETSRDIKYLSDSISGLESYKWDELKQELTGYYKTRITSSPGSLTNESTWWTWDSETKKWQYSLRLYKEENLSILRKYDARTQQWVNYKKVVSSDDIDNTYSEMYIWIPTKSKWIGIKRKYIPKEGSPLYYIWDINTEAWEIYPMEYTDSLVDKEEIYYKWDESSLRWDKYKIRANSSFDYQYYLWDVKAQKWQELTTNDFNNIADFKPDANIYNFDLNPDY